MPYWREWMKKYRGEIFVFDIFGRIWSLGWVSFHDYVKSKWLYSFHYYKKCVWQLLIFGVFVTSYNKKSLISCNKVLTKRH